MNRRELLAGAAGLAAASVLPVAPQKIVPIPMYRYHNGIQFLLGGLRNHPKTGHKCVIWKMAREGEEFSQLEWKQAREWCLILNGLRSCSAIAG